MRTNPDDSASIHWLRLPSAHTLAYWRVGQADGACWLALHGGPGSGAQPSLWRPFDLNRVQVFAPHQRGAGSSKPRGGRRQQTLDALILELEALREALGVASWSVLGGSWGATLALMYAAQHPNAVDALVLRGSFMARTTEVVRLLRRFWPRHSTPLMQGEAVGMAWSGRTLRPANSHYLLQSLAQLFHNGTTGCHMQAVSQAWQTLEQGAALHGAKRAWLNANVASEQQVGRQAWRALRPAMYLRRLQRPSWAARQADNALRQKFRIQSHYLARHCGIQPGAWDSALRAVARARISVQWVHGRYDTVCSPANSIASHKQLSRLPGGRSQLVLTQAGHLGTEPANVWALRQALSLLR